MKKYLMDSLPFWAIPLALYYVVPPFLFRFAAADQGMMAMIVLLLVIQPLAALWAGFLYGVRFGLSVLYPVVIAAAFIPPIYLYYNPTAWPYVPIYGAAAFAGCFVGALSLRHRRRR